MNLLVIDPSKSYRTLVRQILNTNMAEITEAATGSEALQLLKKNKPTAICISHELGDMDSFRFLQKIKINTVLTNTPKFLLTSTNTNEFKRKAYDAGFTEVFIKSDFPSLKRALNSLVLYTTLNISARILYVEDTQSTADYTRNIMESVGWKVVHVKSGEAAAEKLDKSSTPFDLVITDLVLEGQISGMGLINLIRQGKDSIREIPIMAVSGWNDILRQVYVLKHGAGDFIAKPFHENDFLARAINLIMNKRNKDELLAAQSALVEKVYLDALTETNNRHYLDEFGHKLVHNAVEANEAISLMIVDIDYFKDINDMYGHAIGDEVLKRLANILKITNRQQDIVVRYGGDEFIILSKGMNHNQAEARANLIRDQIILTKVQDITFTCSIGLACHDKIIAPELVTLLGRTDLEPSQILDYKSLFKAADDALYQAKELGRNRIYKTLLKDL